MGDRFFCEPTEKDPWVVTAPITLPPAVAS